MGNIKLATFDSIFSNEEEIPKTEIKIDDLIPFHNNPYNLYTKEKEREMVESIKKYGVLHPVTIRPISNGKYEIISGHNRTNCAKLAGLKTIPVLIEHMKDDEAVIRVVESNKQRETVLISEKAKAYKLQYEVMKRMGQITEGSTDELLEKEFGMSGRQVRRYIKLTDLNDGLLDLIDNKKLNRDIGYEVSFLPQGIQTIIFELLIEKIKIKKSHIKEIRNNLNKFSTKDDLLKMLKQEITELKVIKFKIGDFKSYFSENATDDEIKLKIIEALDKMSKISH